MARIGYARVSTAEQNLDRQGDALQTLNLDRVFSDKQSGRSTDRLGLQNMLDFLREGDTLFVESISRIARSTKNLLNIVNILEKKKIAFVSLKESIDTSTPQSRFVVTLFGALAELERATIQERQREGIAAARARGRNLGRPKAKYPTGWHEIYCQWQQGRITAAAAINELGLHRTTFYKLVKQWEAQRQQGVAS